MSMDPGWRPAEPGGGARVIGGPKWFDSENGALVVLVAVPLTAELLVAALYGVAEAGDIATDEDLRGSAAVTLAIEGLAALEARARKIRMDEERGMIESPEFLAHCRQRGAASCRP